MFGSKKTIIVGLAFFLVIGTLFGGAYWSLFQRDSSEQGVKVIVYKSPNCGCCVGYISYLKKHGFSVETVNTTDIVTIKVEYNIPYDMQSCHTMVIGDYFVEGHVSIEAVEKLLGEKPDIDGIGLPGMPSGSPGMPGVKRGEFEIYSLQDGEVSVFMSV